jgi:F-type H+-transporting ATPase subunit b
LLAIYALAFAEGGAQIYPDGSLVFILVLFLIFVFVLNRILFKPIGNVLDERESLTDGARAEARAAVNQYGSRLSEYENSIRQARAEGYRRLEQERAALIAERSKVIEDARREAHARIEQGKAEIASETSAARAALESESHQIAERISRTVLGRTIGGGAD